MCQYAMAKEARQELALISAIGAVMSKDESGQRAKRLDALKKLGASGHFVERPEVDERDKHKAERDRLRRELGIPLGATRTVRKG